METDDNITDRKKNLVFIEGYGFEEKKIETISFDKNWIFCNKFPLDMVCWHHMSNKSPKV